MVRVLPEQRGQGIGTGSTRPFRSTRGAWVATRSGDGSSRTTRHRASFARNRGFREAGREYEVVLDTAQADIVAILAERHRARLARRAARPRGGRPRGRLRGLGRCPRPEGDDFEPPALRQRWHELYLEGPGAVPDALIAALAGDEVVGYTGLRRRGASSPVAENLLTAVRRPGAGAESPSPSSGADRASTRGRHRADLHDERRDERGHARRQRAPRLPPRPTQIVVTGPARYVMSRRRVSTTATAPSTTR